MCVCVCVCVCVFVREREREREIVLFCKYSLCSDTKGNWSGRSFLLYSDSCLQYSKEGEVRAVFTISEGARCLR